MGRILRQGNMFSFVHVFRYVTAGTFDSYLFQTVEAKQKVISQVMTNKSPLRSCPDIDETVLSYAEIKTLAAGDIRIKEKMELDNDVNRLQLEKSSHEESQKRLQNILDTYPEKIDKFEIAIRNIQQDILSCKAPETFTMKVGNVDYDKRTEAGAAILKHIGYLHIGHERQKIGEYAGLEMYGERAHYDTKIILKANHEYQVDVGTSSLGNVTRIENTLSTLSTKEQDMKMRVEMMRDAEFNAKENIGIPFTKDDELKSKLEQQAALNFELEMAAKEKKGMDIEAEIDIDEFEV